MISPHDLREAAAEIDVLRWFHANGTIVYDEKPRAPAMQRRQDQLMRLAEALRDHASEIDRAAFRQHSAASA